MVTKEEFHNRSLESALTEAESQEATRECAMRPTYLSRGVVRAHAKMLFLFHWSRQSEFGCRPRFVSGSWLGDVNAERQWLLVS